MQADAQMDVDTNENVQRKGRGFNSNSAQEDDNKPYESIAVDGAESSTAVRAQRSVEGWILIVTGVHEEASEEDLQDKFGDYGEIKNLHLNLDRRTGYVKGYALVEYETEDEAKAAIAGASGSQLLEQTLTVDFAFVRPPVGQTNVKGSGARKGRGRSASPTRKSLITRID
ncbi:hypothetical protein BCR35DRAFT_295093 [Leucosporidium creatinivorum]|uniref:RNA-binding protein 8A n=1 Tax=Leucosporidium creatinivorum TaxID=106004 RepID=A0A1Y2E279_9BASI|nr:hypothetical protein BCR35DRAFT_295093 [Leucosporidium creatinivorum]